MIWKTDLCKFSTSSGLNTIDRLCRPHENEDNAIASIEKESETEKPVVPPESLDESASYVYSQDQRKPSQQEHDRTDYDCGYWIEAKLLDVAMHSRRPMHHDLPKSICVTNVRGIGKRGRGFRSRRLGGEQKA